MEGVSAIYLGQIVDKKHFRTFVYSMDGSKKLVESWDEYERQMASGIWFSTKEDALARIPVEKPTHEITPEIIKTPELKEEKPSMSSGLLHSNDGLKNRLSKKGK